MDHASQDGVRSEGKGQDDKYDRGCQDGCRHLTFPSDGGLLVSRRLHGLPSDVMTSQEVESEDVDNDEQEERSVGEENLAPHTHGVDHDLV